MRVLLFVVGFATFIASWVFMALALEAANGGSYYSGNTVTEGHNPTLAFILFFISLPVSFLCFWIPARMMRD